MISKTGKRDKIFIDRLREFYRNVAILTTAELQRKNRLLKKIRQIDGSQIKIKTNRDKFMKSNKLQPIHI